MQGIEKVKVFIHTDPGIAEGDINAFLGQHGDNIHKVKQSCSMDSDDLLYVVTSIYYREI